MLKEEVIEAAKAGKFNIYAVKTINEGIEFLTGKKAGMKLADGKFEENTVNYLVDKQLRENVDKLRQFGSFESQKKTES